jgi:hypothetical protein
MLSAALLALYASERGPQAPCPPRAAMDPAPDDRLTTVLRAPARRSGSSARVRASVPA